MIDQPSRLKYYLLGQVGRIQKTVLAPSGYGKGFSMPSNRINLVEVQGYRALDLARATSVIAAEIQIVFFALGVYLRNKKLRQ